MPHEERFDVPDNDPFQALRNGMDQRRRSRAELLARIEDKYIKTGRDEKLLGELTSLVDANIRSSDRRRPEGRMLVVTGEPGAGKTWAVERALANVPGLLGPLLISLNAPRPCTLKQLGRAILHALGYPLQRDLLEHLTWEKVRLQLKLRQVRFLWLDELHHVVSKNEEELKKLRDTLKNVMQQPDWPVSIIVSGVPDAAAFLTGDRQVERRSRTLEFERLKFPQNIGLLRKIVRGVVEDHAGMRLDSLDSDEFLHRLCRATEGAFGSTIALTRLAVLEAFDRGETAGLVRIRDFAKAYAAERGCEASQNIFLAKNWHEIEPSRSRMRDAAEDR
jgi:hypothetical protein